MNNMAKVTCAPSHCILQLSFHREGLLSLLMNAFSSCEMDVVVNLTTYVEPAIHAKYYPNKRILA